MTALPQAIPENWCLTPLAPDLSLDCDAPPPCLDAETEHRIEAIWQSARLRHPDLYNGRVFCLSSMSETQLSGFWCEYRWVLARMKSEPPDILQGLRPLAVTAVLLCRDGVVLGRRSRESLYLPGYWQGVPAGSVESRDGGEAVDLRAQLLEELTEEVGLASAVETEGPLLACEHARTGIVDLGFLIRSALDFASVEKAWAETANREYDRLTCIAYRDLPDFSDAVLPTTRALLDRITP